MLRLPYFGYSHLLRVIPQVGSRESPHNASDRGIDNELAATWKRKGLDRRNPEYQTATTILRRGRDVKSDNKRNQRREQERLKTRKTELDLNTNLCSVTGNI
jgi:hypothetical protein